MSWKKSVLRIRGSCVKEKRMGKMAANSETIANFAVQIIRIEHD